MHQTVWGTNTKCGRKGSKEINKTGAWAKPWGRAAISSQQKRSNPELKATTVLQGFAKPRGPGSSGCDRCPAVVLLSEANK